MAYIEPRMVKTDTPQVSIRKPTGQRCVAFNAALTNEFSLKSYSHMAVDLDRENETITFYPMKSATREKDGVRGYPLMSDGAGGNSAGRAIFLHVGDLTEKMVPTGRYDATIKAKCFSISYGND